jgi:ketosteroid isomerase-like protein
MSTVLDPDVRRLIDRAALVDLVGRLGAHLDHGRFDALPELFVPDATVDTPGGVAHGANALVAQARRNHQDAVTQHLLTNVVVEHGDDDPDAATIEANLLVTFAEADGRLQQRGGRYELGVTRTPAGWRFSRLRVIPLWVTGD